jgi:glycopeptide antibiotics resistance protein
MGDRRANLVPFSEPSILSSENILNVIIFVPLGIYAGTLFKKWLIVRKLFLFFLLTFIVEGLQYIFRLGAFDVTDIVTNTFGGVIGLLIFKGLCKTFNNHVKAQKFINIIAATGTALMILLLVLLKMNTLPVRYQ